MPWSSRLWSSDQPRAAPAVISCLALLLALVLAVSGFADEKRLSVYSGATSYSLTVREKNGLDYVGLLEILQPLGPVSARTRWPGLETEFQRRGQRIHSRGNSGAGARTNLRSSGQLPARKRTRPGPPEFIAVTLAASSPGPGKFPRSGAAIVHRQRRGPLYRPGEPDKSPHPGDELYLPGESDDRDRTGKTAHGVYSRAAGSSGIADLDL